MKSDVRIAMLASVLAGAAAILHTADLSAHQPAGLTVHEWGTFTSVAGDDGSAIEWDVLGGKDDLPGFVNDRGYRCLSLKVGLAGTVRMETPVIYFYSPLALDARVRVAFPKGLITEWYPQAECQIDHHRLGANLGNLDLSMSRLTGGIEWKDIKVEPNTAPVLPFEERPSRYYAARATDAAPVSVGSQHEKFLFYRGVGRVAVPVSARIFSDGSVVVANSGPDPVQMVILLESRGGRLGYRNAGAVPGSITLNRPSLDDSVPQLRHDLENALVSQGLFRKEAQAMVATWQDSWFEEGSRLIYIVPSRALDSMLPLQVDPSPSQTARVFVGRMELITSETKRAVEEAIAKDDRSVIDRYGRFLEPILERISSENPAGASRLDQLRLSVKSSFAEGACRSQNFGTTDQRGR
ncbi:MAG TPA: hypothetical protein VKR61_15530 [Bryobacteraceae bacterium]|nr:hypothetical protein [Bryobacteraceae bacterium]